MKLTILLCAAISLAATINTSAQQFVNGSFEPKAGHNLTKCTDQPVAKYNENIHGSNAVGTATTIAVADASCSSGSAVQGANFVIMKYSPPYGNAINFKLDKPMTIGTSYSISLSYKLGTGQQAQMNSVRFGYAQDSLGMDSLSGYTDPVTATTWTKDTLTFTPKKAWQYVWIEVSTLGGEDLTLHVDNLNMIGIPSSVNNVIKETDAVQVWPNPAHTAATVNISEQLTLPCTIQLYDITGRQVSGLQYVNTRTAGVNISNYVSGVYFIKLADADNRVYTTRLMVE